MNKKVLSFKIAAVFIGTVVGAGLASGQEIIQFFTVYGFKGMLGVSLCGILYIITGVITVDMSYKYDAASYRDLIYLSCGKYLGSVIDFLTTFFLFGGTCIILAGSGSIFHESLGLPNITGIIVMAAVTAAVVFRSTDGLMFINSIIVPSMIIIILFISVMVFSGKPSAVVIINSIAKAPAVKTNWLFSSLLYMAFNMLCATGVLCPMTKDIKKSSGVYAGAVLGAVGLFFLTALINIILILNVPHVFKFSIPMLYIANNTGKIAGSILPVIIWLEMFSTEVANVYSLAKKMYYNFKLDYKLSVVILLLLAFPFTKIGFENLIHLLYPAFGVISMIYIICLIRLYFRSKRNGRYRKVL